jgi:uncharacterized membrane protein YdjX (TVP38/TMEM64 family)
MAFVLIVVVGRMLGDQLPRLLERVHALGAWGPLTFIALYAVAVVFFAPGSILTVSAGALFGLWLGVALAFTGASIGATAAFLIARTVGRRAVESRVAGDPRIAAIDRAVAAQGRRIVFLLRLSPAIPFNLLNYALGLTRVSLPDYVAGFAGMLPVTILYVYSGKLAGELAAVAGSAASTRGTGHFVVLTLGLVATLVVTILVTRLARRALSDATASTGTTVRMPASPSG